MLFSCSRINQKEDCVKPLLLDKPDNCILYVETNDLDSHKSAERVAGIIVK